MKLYPLFLALSLLTTAAAPNAGSVRGFVFAPDGRSIQGATVKVGDRSVVTDHEGAFFLELDEGEYSFVVEAPGRPEIISTKVPILAGQQSEVLIVYRGEGGAEVELEVPEEAVQEMELKASETATVSGRVFAQSKQAPVEGARVFVRGTPIDARTGADGTFTLHVPAGHVELTVIHPSHATANVPLEVPASGTIVEIPLEEKAVELAEMVVIAPKLEGDVTFALQERRESSKVTDLLGSEQMAKSGDSDAAAALRRVTGITVVDGRFVYVRGLGERYSATLLNGSTLPSPDPERRVIPLDLFPAGMLSSIEVQKTYSPDLPGEFGGGLVLLQTQNIPEEFHAKIGLGGALRSHVTGRAAQTYSGSSTDFLTFGSGPRALPPDVLAASKEHQFKEGTRFTPGYTPQELEHFGEELDLRFGTQETTVPPDFDVSGEIGGRFDLFGADAGALLGVSMGNDFSWTRKRTTIYSTDGTTLEVQNKLNAIEEFKRNAVLSSLLTFGIDFSDEHKIKATVTLNRLAEDSTLFAQGYIDDDQANVKINRLWWIEQMLLGTQLNGTHVFLPGTDLEVDWRYMFSIATRDEPNRREIKYVEDTGRGTYIFSQLTAGNQRFYSSLLDFNHDLGVNVKLPVKIFGQNESKLQTGVAGVVKTREVDSRRYRYELKASGDRLNEILVLNPDSIFSADTIGANGFAFEEVTLPDDNYNGAQTIVGGYVMGDLAFTENLHLLTGARLEYSRQKIETTSAVGDDKAVAGELKTTDILPAATLTWAFVEGMQLRLGYARTVNRPNFRELSPTRFIDVTTNIEYRGNPDLERALIDHFDLRWEWYPSESETVSAAAFAKTFQHPIETRVDGGANWVYSPVNVPSANNFGFEFDFRKQLGFITPVLESLYVASNLTLVWSSVDVGSVPGLTSKERPLQGQSPYAMNAQIGWDDSDNDLSIALLFNVFGRRIDSVGALGIPDIYEEPFPTLDLVAKKKMGRFGFGFKMGNILDRQATKAISADYPTEEFFSRRAFSGSLSVDLD